MKTVSVCLIVTVICIWVGLFCIADWIDTHDAIHHSAPASIEQGADDTLSSINFITFDTAAQCVIFSFDVNDVLHIKYENCTPSEGAEIILKHWQELWKARQNDPNQ